DPAAFGLHDPGLRDAGVLARRARRHAVARRLAGVHRRRGDRGRRARAPRDPEHEGPAHDARRRGAPGAAGGPRRARQAPGVRRRGARLPRAAQPDELAHGPGPPLARRRPQQLRGRGSRVPHARPEQGVALHGPQQVPARLVGERVDRAPGVPDVRPPGRVVRRRGGEGRRRALEPPGARPRGGGDRSHGAHGLRHLQQPTGGAAPVGVHRAPGGAGARPGPGRSAALQARRRAGAGAPTHVRGRPESGRPPRMMLRRLLLNAGSIVTHETLNRATTFVLYLIVARYLDDAAFGRLSLSLTLLYIVQVLAGFGLRTYMSREVARDRATAGRYLGNGLVVSLAASLVALGLLAALTWGAGYPPETRRAVLLFGLGAVPYAVGSVCQGLFQGLERMQLIPAVNVPANVLKLAAAVLLLEGGSGIGAVALAVTGSQLLAAGVSLVLALRLVGAAGVRAAVDRESLVAVARGSAAFMGIDAVVAVWSVLPLFLLSLYASEAEVGHFGAATQLLVPASLVVTAVMVAALPTLSRGFVEGAA